MSLLSALLNDIQLIVFKYLHRYYYQNVIQQYNSSIKCSWHDDSNQFDGFCVINFRELTSYEYDNHPIYSFAGVQRTYTLSRNYIYAQIWLPVSNTHQPHRHRGRK